MRWAFAVFVLAAAGCSNDLGALYRVMEKAADSGAPAAAMPKLPLPALPALPDADRIAGCERCAASTCATARANCLEDDNCTDELRCKGTCSDPACLQTCSAENGWSPWYADYSNCVFGQCPSECNTGNNFGCQRNYDWPAADPKSSSFVVEFRFTAPPTYFLGNATVTNVAGATVRACSDDMDCPDGSEQDGAKVGLDNTVTLKLVAESLQPKDFRGYLEIEGGSGGDHERFYPTPLSRPGAYFAGFLGGIIGPPMLDLARPRVAMAVSDCLIAPVAGARVTLPDFPAITAFGFTSRFAFPAGPTTATGIAVLVNLPDSAASTKLRVRSERNTGELISERLVWVRPGFSTWLALGPAARSN